MGFEENQLMYVNVFFEIIKNKSFAPKISFRKKTRLLFGGIPAPLNKYEFVSWSYYSQYMESHKNPWFQTTNRTYCW